MTTLLSNVIQARLAYLEITKEQLAERSGLGRSTIYSYASGTRTDLQASTLRKLAEGLDMTPAELVAEVNGIPANKDLSPDEVETVTLYRRVPPSQRDTARQVLRALGVAPAQLSSNRGRLDTTKRQQSGPGQLGNNQGEGPKRPRKGTLPRHYPSTRVPFLGTFGRLLVPAPAL